MAICKSATRYDSDSYYETVVNEETEDVTVRGTNNGEPVEYSLGSGGGGDMLVATIHSDASLTNVSIDKTFNELKSAIQNGVPVYGRVEITQNDAIIAIGAVNAINMNLLAQFGMQDMIIFESVGYMDNGESPATITQISHTEYTLLYDDTLTVKIAEINLGNA